ncbi:MAG TPA: radical SAM protein [Spirochaetota bacterium]|nr:radical SAM protein [Spirochaetota bacterium]
MMKKKILFVQPTVYDDSGRLIKKDRLYFVGLAFPLLAALMPSDWEVEICIETIENVPFDTDASVIGVGGMGHAANRGREIAVEFKKRGKIVLMGGPMVSLIPEIAKEYCDAVIVGDGEDVLRNVIEDIEKNDLKSYYKKELQKLSTPLPRFDLILDKKIGDFLPVQAGRGCPNSCSFCTIYCMYRNKYLKREIEEVLRDIKYVKTLGFRKFLLIDDNIVSDKEYIRELCKEIKKLGMKWMSQCAIDIARDEELLRIVADSGCISLSIGLESINKDSLKSIDKTWCNPDEYKYLIDGIVGAGIDVATEMIVGIDNDTRESLIETIRFIINTKIIAPKFYIMTPIVGTDLYYKFAEEGRIVEKNIFSFSPSRAVINHPHMSTEELNEMFWMIYDRLYTVRNLLRRTVLHKRFFKDPVRYLFFLYVNLFYRYQVKRRIAPIIM